VPGLRVCIDVDDLERAAAFYARALGLAPGRRYRSVWLEMLGAPVPIDLVAHAAGEPPSPAAPSARRDYARHWTPVHLDVVVEDVDAAVARAVEAGAKVEVPAREEPYGRIAILSDPFGHGFCLLQMSEKGYDAVVGGARGELT
jgi:predicted enzyme related to lactoylglutathione lyase